MNTPITGGVWGQSRVNLLFALLLCLVKLFFSPSFQLLYKKEKKKLVPDGFEETRKDGQKAGEIMDYGCKEGKTNEGKKYVELWHPFCFPLSRCHHVESKMSLSFKNDNS